MCGNINEVTLTGKCISKPIVRTSNYGKDYCNFYFQFDLALSDRQNIKRHGTIKTVAFGRRVKKIANIQNGMILKLTGHLDYDIREDVKDKHSLIISSCEILDDRPDELDFILRNISSDSPITTEYNLDDNSENPFLF